MAIAKFVNGIDEVHGAIDSVKEGQARRARLVCRWRPQGPQSYAPDGSKTEIKTIPVKEITPKDGYYIFKCNVSAKEMTSIIKAQIYDGETPLGTEYNYFVEEYANYLLSHTGDKEEYEKAAPLVEKMLQYGAYAKEYFDKTDKLPNLGEVTIDIDNPVIGEFPDGTTFDGATLSLKSQTTLSLYFTSGVEGLTFTCIEEPVEGMPDNEMTVETVTTETGYIACIRDISASKLKKTISLLSKTAKLYSEPSHTAR